MKKIIFILITSLVMMSCNNVKTKTETKIDASEVICPYESYEEELECGKITYKDSILIYVDYNDHGDTVTNKIENIIYKDIEIHCDNLGGTGKIGSFINRIFYHWKTKQVYMVVNNFNKVPELYDGESGFVLFRWKKTLDEVEEIYL